MTRWSKVLTCMFAGLALAIYTGCEPRDVDVDTPAGDVDVDHEAARMDAKDDGADVDVRTPIGDVKVDQNDDNVDVDVDAGDEK